MFTPPALRRNNYNKGNTSAIFLIFYFSGYTEYTLTVWGEIFHIALCLFFVN